MSVSVQRRKARQKRCDGSFVAGRGRTSRPASSRSACHAVQPFLLDVYTYSFVTILTGTVMFIIVTKFPD